MGATFGPHFRWACMLGIHAWTRTLGPSIHQQGCRHCHKPRRRA